MALRLITPPAQEPVSLVDAKLHLRVSDPAEDALIRVLIAAARQAAEQELCRALITQTWELLLDRFPIDAIALPRNPVQSVTSIQYRDSDGVLQTFAATNYKLDAASLIARVVPGFGLVWPETREEINAVSVVFVAGFGNAGATVPASIRQWMLLQVGHWYEHRASAEERELWVTPFLGGLLDPHRVPML